jgi:hypothetical protein
MATQLLGYTVAIFAQNLGGLIQAYGDWPREEMPQWQDAPNPKAGLFVFQGNTLALGVDDVVQFTPSGLYATSLARPSAPTGASGYYVAKIVRDGNGFPILDSYGRVQWQ